MSLFRRRHARVLPLTAVAPETIGSVVRTARGVEIPLFAKGWGPEAVYDVLAWIEALPECAPESRRV